MQIIPAIDLKDNKCVRLSKGEDTSSLIFNNNPEKQAKYFEDIGCKKIHIVDLDAAFGRPEINISSIEKIRKSVSLPIQLGGGIRNLSIAEKYFKIGIDYLILGSMSVNNIEDVKFISSKYQDRIYVSLDIKGEEVMVKGWKEPAKLKLEEIINIYNNTEIKGYVITDIMNDGMLQGLNISFVKFIVTKLDEPNSQNKKFILAGGLTNYKDIEKLKNMKLPSIEGIISGKSFYVGNIDLVKAQKLLDADG